MEGLPAEPTTLFLFLFLLPGFLGLQVYDYLTVGAKRDGLQKIVTALCLTLLSDLAVRALAGIELIQLPKITKETPVSEVLGEFLGLNLLYLSVASIVFAAVFAVLNNHGILYRVARFARLTRRTGRDNVWQDLFNGTRRSWLRVYLKDGRRLVGWRRLASDDASLRELYLADVVWWMPNARAPGGFAEEPSGASGVYLGNFDEITVIEVFDDAEI